MNLHIINNFVRKKISSLVVWAYTNKKNSELSPYLVPNRLGDVLALIQVLAYHENSDLCEKEINNELQRAPLSSVNWMFLVEEHHELFRVYPEKSNKQVALVSRHLLPYITTSDQKQNRPKLELSIVNKLMELTIELHDRQLTRKNQWKTFIPLVVGIVGSTAIVTAAIIKGS